jgi:hypothetical protein
MLTGPHKSRDDKKENEEADSDRVIHAFNIRIQGDSSMRALALYASSQLIFAA